MERYLSVIIMCIEFKEKRDNLRFLKIHICQMYIRVGRFFRFSVLNLYVGLEKLWTTI